MKSKGTAASSDLFITFLASIPAYLFFFPIKAVTHRGAFLSEIMSQKKRTESPDMYDTNLLALCFDAPKNQERSNLCIISRCVWPTSKE